MSKALGLLSGGLDSSLAALALKRQGIDVTCVCFVTPFFGSAKAEKAAAQMDIPLRIWEISDVHLEMIKKPKYGFGKNMNPCIDCHAMMFRLAGEMMEKEGFDFLFSGEVLGQRPMSQNPNALRAVQNYSGFSAKVLRPLSALLLPETQMEKQGLVERSELLDIQGRSRRRQQEFAMQWGLTDYPPSGGGCLLTEPAFSGRLRDLIDHVPSCGPVDVEILKAGRQFRLSERTKLAIGRCQDDNDRLKQLHRPGQDYLLHNKNYTGPLGVISGTPDEQDLEMAAAIIASYGRGQNEPEVEVVIVGQSQTSRIVAPMDRDISIKLML